MKYKMLVLYDPCSVRYADIQKLEKEIENHQRTRGFQFECAIPEIDSNALGAMVRSILWAEGYSSQLIFDHKIAVKVYEKIPNLLPDKWKEIGSWDCGGIQYNCGRY